MNKLLLIILKGIYKIILFFLFTLAISQEITPVITMERKKLIVLTNESQDSEISQKITQIASSSATQLNRFEIIDRGQLHKILEEQKLQHSGIIDQNQAIEIGKLVAANDALLIKVQNFGQKGVPKQTQEEEKEESNTGLFGWIVKEVVKAGIDKNMEGVERYPNNIQTIIDGEVFLFDIESGESIASFTIRADYTGGVKAKSLSRALDQIRSQIISNLKSLYLLSSEVLNIQGNKIMLLLGKDMGVRQGTLFEISTLDNKRKIRDREVTIPGRNVGIVEVNTISEDISQGRILRQWDTIEPGYQAHEISQDLFVSGISGFYGGMPANIRLRIIGYINPFHRLGSTAFGGIGLVKDSRDNSDFQFSLGFSLNYHLFQTSSFSIGPMLSVPFDFHMRMDDEDTEGVSHYVFLPITSPRIGAQSEIIINSKIDLVIGFEYVVTSVNLGTWTYTEEQEDDSDESKTWNANWDERGMPEIDYQGWVFNIGIRRIFY